MQADLKQGSHQTTSGLHSVCTCIQLEVQYIIKKKLVTILGKCTALWDEPEQAAVVYVAPRLKKVAIIL